MGDVSSAAAIAGAHASVFGEAIPLVSAQRILEAVPAIIYVYDLKAQRGLFQNRHLGEFLGRPPDADSRRDMYEWERFLHPDDVQRFVAYRDAMFSIRPGEARSWEFRLLHQDGTWRWFRTRDVLLEADEEGKPLLMVGSATEVTEQKKSEEHQEMVLQELRHRARNASAMIEAIGRQSLPPNQPEVEEYYKTYVARLRALFSTADLILASSERHAPFRDVIETALRPFRADAEDERFRLDGPSLDLSEQVAGAIALSVHELSTNASKYGALSNATGKIVISWRNEAGVVSFEWKEMGGPAVHIPNREGFGTRVIRFLVTRQAGGTVDLGFEPDGVRCCFQFKL